MKVTERLTGRYFQATPEGDYDVVRSNLPLDLGATALGATATTVFLELLYAPDLTIRVGCTVAAVSGVSSLVTGEMAHFGPSNLSNISNGQRKS